MITVVNKSNKGLYNELFEEVQNWLYTHDSGGNEVLPDSDGTLDPSALLRYVQVQNAETGEWEDTEELETITSLEELFTNMEFITRFAPIYTRLPLDEEPFFIDANKRTISVPKDFASNGVSVQGDEIAEVLFFKINRFFDATDLSTCDIFIQWKSSELDEETGSPKEGVSRPWVQDIVSEPGYLIFGWPISSKITKAPGPITFSIRFYRLDNSDKLVYSFSTLDQTVVVKPALDYDIENIVNDTEFVDDMAGLIKGRAINSPNTSSTLNPDDPEWEEGILDALYDERLVYYVLERPTGTWRIAHLNMDENGFSSQPVEMVIAAVSDEGIVSYKWSKVDGVSDQLDEYLSDGETQYYQVVAYIEDNTAQADRVINKTYYYNDGNKYKAIGPNASLDDVREEWGTVYQLVAIAIADEVGRYIGAARNRLGKVFSDDLATDALVFLKPSVPELGELQASNEAILSEEPVELTLESVTLDDELGYNEAGSGCKATYQWFRRALGSERTSSAAMEDMVEDTLTLSPTDDAAEGWYKVQVTNNLNNETASETSEEIRVTKPARKVVLSIDETNIINVTEARANKLHVYVEGLEDVATREPEDTVTYQWYEYRSAGRDSDLDAADAKIGMYADSTGGHFNDKNMSDADIEDEMVISSSKTPEFMPPNYDDGIYFCVVTNTYHGTSKSVASPFYQVTL